MDYNKDDGDIHSGDVGPDVSSAAPFGASDRHFCLGELLPAGAAARRMEPRAPPFSLYEAHFTAARPMQCLSGWVPLLSPCFKERVKQQYRSLRVLCTSRAVIPVPGARGRKEFLFILLSAGALCFGYQG